MTATLAIGQRTERLGFQRKLTTDDGQGGRVGTFATFATVWAAVEPVSGREALAATGAMRSEVAYRVRVAQQQLEETALALSSLVRSGTIATATTASAHGLTTGQYARIAGAGESAYNGKVQVTVSSPTAFTFTVSGNPATPATGTITATPLTPIAPTLRIAWTPSWDAAQPAKTLRIHAVRLLGRDEFELECSEVI